jgi:hypothetical protein
MVNSISWGPAGSELTFYGTSCMCQDLTSYRLVRPPSGHVRFPRQKVGAHHRNWYLRPESIRRSVQLRPISRYRESSRPSNTVKGNKRGRLQRLIGSELKKRRELRELAVGQFSWKLGKENGNRTEWDLGHLWDANWPMNNWWAKNEWKWIVFIDMSWSHQVALSIGLTLPIDNYVRPSRFWFRDMCCMPILLLLSLISSTISSKKKNPLKMLRMTHKRVFGYRYFFFSWWKAPSCSK